MDFAVFDEVNVVAAQSPEAVYHSHIDQVLKAEELGFHSYWFAEHHFATHRAAPSPNLMLAAAARETSKILLGNMVNVLPFHNPVRLAEECAVLDQLTGGRLQVGVGRGVQPPEFRRLRVDMAKSREMFLESVGMLKQLWTHPGASRVGEYWSYEDVTIMPPVRQRPHPPLWFTGLSRESMLWAAENGLPFASTFHSPEAMKAMATEYKERFRPSEQCSEPVFVVMRHLYVGESMQEARRDVGHVYDRLFRAWLDVALTSESGVPDSYKSYPKMHARLGAMGLDELIAEGIVLFGGPEDVAAGVEGVHEQGADVLMIWVAPEDVLPEFALKCLELFAAEVMPRFTGAAIAS